MASRCRSISQPALFSLKSAIRRSVCSSQASSSPLLSRPSRFASRIPGELGCLQSLLPLHTAIATSRLKACLGVDAKGSRSLSKGTTIFCTSKGI